MTFSAQRLNNTPEALCFGRCFHVVTVRYSGMIASLGQTPAQVPQSMQVLGSIT